MERLYDEAVFEIDTVFSRLALHQSGQWTEALELEPGGMYPYQQLLECFVQRCVVPEDRAQLLRAGTLLALLVSFRGQATQSIRFRAHLPGEKVSQWYCIHLAAPIHGKIYGILENIQQEKEREQMLLRQAARDPMTGLLNRGGFVRRFVELTEHSGSTGAAFLLDIDNFKEINDSCGHLYGDRTISAVAAFLQAEMPTQTIIGRFGGDEFVMFLPDIQDKVCVRRLAWQLCQTPICQERETPLSISVGIAFWPAQGLTLDGLLERADSALYTAKAKGKQCAVLFDDVATERSARWPQSRHARRWERMGEDHHLAKLTASGIWVLLSLVWLLAPGLSSGAGRLPLALLGLGTAVGLWHTGRRHRRRKSGK